jgi:hypothetical protein
LKFTKFKSKFNIFTKAKKKPIELTEIPSQSVPVSPRFSLQGEVFQNTEFGTALQSSLEKETINHHHQSCLPEV